MRPALIIFALVNLVLFIFFIFNLTQKNEKEEEEVQERSISNEITKVDLLEKEQELILQGARNTEKVFQDEVVLYVVKEGDTLASIAQENDISMNTLLWANDIDSREDVKVGETLFILPITGIKHRVGSSETIEDIAKSYNADIDEIIAFNDLPATGEIKSGQEIIVPGGEVASPSKVEELETKEVGASEESLRLVTRFYLLMNEEDRNSFVEKNGAQGDSHKEVIEKYAQFIDKDKSAYIFIEEVLLKSDLDKKRWAENRANRKLTDVDDCQKEMAKYSSCLQEHQIEMSEYNTCMSGYEVSPYTGSRITPTCAKPYNFCSKPFCAGL